MTELLETVCEKMRDYGTTTDPATGHRGYTRINTRPGESLTITNVNLSSGGSEELTNAVSPKPFHIQPLELVFFQCVLWGDAVYCSSPLPLSVTMLLGNMKRSLLTSMEMGSLRKRLKMSCVMRSQVCVQVFQLRAMQTFVFPDRLLC